MGGWLCTRTLEGKKADMERDRGAKRRRRRRRKKGEGGREEQGEEEEEGCRREETVWRPSTPR